MKKFNLLEDLHTITDISNSELSNLQEGIQTILISDIVESTSSLDPLINIDIGIGNLVILLENQQIQYLFTPSEEFEHQLQDKLATKSSSINEALYKKLNTALLSVIKGLVL